MYFRDRAEAGRRLAAALGKYRDRPGIVYPLPRGGVPLALEIAAALHMPIDLVIPRKIGHPYNPEYAVCAVCETGDPVCNEEELARLDRQWLARQLQIERSEARRRRNRYLQGRAPLPATGKIAILIDDGIATGLTMRAAVREVKGRGPAHVVVAVPVSPRDTAALLRQEVDELVTLDTPDLYLGAVGAYYEDFSPVSDEQVVALLRRAERIAATG